jgi:hypothetical protein
MNLRHFDWLWLFVVGTASSAWCITAAQQLGATYDEPTYLEHGLHFWRTGSHRQLMRLGTMPLPVDVQTLPLAIAERFRGQPWDWDRDCERILPWMRHGNLVFWWLLLAGGMTLGRDLAGSWGGRWAVTVLALEPNLLAHAALATTDIAITATLVCFVIAYRRGRGGDWKARIGWPGFWMGLALLSKASALAFAPLAMAAVEISHWFGNPDNDWRTQIKNWWHDGIRIGLIGTAIMFLGCGCDFQAQGTFVEWAKSLPEGSGRTTMVRQCRRSNRRPTQTQYARPWPVFARRRRSSAILVLLSDVIRDQTDDSNYYFDATTCFESASCVLNQRGTHHRAMLFLL